MAVNAKGFSAAFFHISSLKNANTSNNTAATIQPNPFWFWENITVFSCFCPLIAHNSTCEGPKEQVHEGKC